jgi:hypothetical protein
MRQLLFIILLYFISFSISAQEYIVQYKPFGTKNWGYINLDGTVVIEPQYRMCYEFSEQGIAAVYYSKRNHYDLINLQNQVIDVEPEKFILKEGFGYGAQGFSSGVMIYQHRGKWGAMNSQGKILFPRKFDFISIFADGYATAFIDKDFYVLDNKGNEFPIMADDIVKIKKFSEGMAIFTDKTGLQGFINTKGEVAIAAKFEKLGYFSADVAWARNDDGLIGYIDKQGEWVIEPKFLAVKDFDPDSGLAMARLDDVWGFINKQGEIKYIDDVDKFYNYSEGLVKVVKEGLFGFMDKNMDWVIKPQFGSARDFHNGYAAVRFDGGWGIIDKAGNWVIKPLYDRIKDVSIIK